MKYIRIPSNIDYEKLFSSITCNEICRQELIEATYVFLSFLYPSKKHLKNTKRFNGYKPIDSTKMNQILRNRFSSVKTLLLNPDSHPSGPIILETKHQSGVIPKCYRLNEELFSNPGEKWVKLGENASKRLIKFEQEGKEKQNQFQLPYQFLIDKFNADITIENEAVQFVNSLKKLLLQKISDYSGDKDEMKKKVISKIKEMKTKINNVKKKNFRPKVSRSNHRLNSVITDLNRELRYYLRIEGKKLVEVDVKSSQPYVLSTILCDRFFSNNDINNEYSLISIYPQLYNLLYNISSQYTDTITLLIEKSLYNNKEGFPKYFMFGGLDSSPEIQRFRNIPFSEGFYRFFDDNYLGGSYDIQKVKDQIMLVLNLEDLNKREHIDLIQDFKLHFPDINSFLESINSLKKIKSSGAILLQRSESYLFLRVGCQKIHNRLEGVPFLTVHDSVLIEEQYSEFVGVVLADTLTSFTGIKPGVSVKSIDDPMENLVEICQEMWDELLNSKKF